MFGMVCVDVLVSALCVLFVYITWGERERDFVNINILSLISILIFFFFFLILGGIINKVTIAI